MELAGNASEIGGNDMKIPEIDALRKPLKKSIIEMGMCRNAQRLKISLKKKVKSDPKPIEDLDEKMDLAYNHKKVDAFIRNMNVVKE